MLQVDKFLKDSEYRQNMVYLGQKYFLDIKRNIQVLQDTKNDLDSAVVQLALEHVSRKKKAS